MTQFNEFDSELAAEATYGITAEDYAETGAVFAEMDAVDSYARDDGHVCDCDYCGEISLCYADGSGGKACSRCMCDDGDDMSEFDDDMDGDFDSGMASAGYGTDEDYGYYGYDTECDLWGEM